MVIPLCEVTTHSKNGLQEVSRNAVVPISVRFGDDTYLYELVSLPYLCRNQLDLSSANSRDSSDAVTPKHTYRGSHHLSLSLP